MRFYRGRSSPNNKAPR